jgi:hypothetical protein
MTKLEPLTLPNETKLKTTPQITETTIEADKPLVLKNNKQIPLGVTSPLWGHVV